MQTDQKHPPKRNQHQRLIVGMDLQLDIPILMIIVAHKNVLAAISQVRRQVIFPLIDLLIRHEVIIRQ